MSLTVPVDSPVVRSVVSLMTGEPVMTVVYVCLMVMTVDTGTMGAVAPGVAAVVIFTVVIVACGMRVCVVCRVATGVGTGVVVAVAVFTVCTVPTGDGTGVAVAIGIGVFTVCTVPDGDGTGVVVWITRGVPVVCTRVIAITGMTRTQQIRKTDRILPLSLSA